MTQKSKIRKFNNPQPTNIENAGIVRNQDYNNVVKDITEIYSELQAIKPYKVYTALLTQSGTNAPVATVLENTIGDIVWTYDTVGGYEGILVGAFPLGKTFMQIGNVSNTRGIYIQHNQPMDSVYIEVTANDGVTYINGLLDNTSLEIRVYN